MNQRDNYKKQRRDLLHFQLIINKIVILLILLKILKVHLNQIINKISKY